MSSTDEREHTMREGGRTSHKRRVLHNTACAACARHHRACDKFLPCARCIERGIAHLCAPPPKAPRFINVNFATLLRDNSLRLLMLFRSSLFVGAAFSCGQDRLFRVGIYSTEPFQEALKGFSMIPTPVLPPTLGSRRCYCIVVQPFVICCTSQR